MRHGSEMAEDNPYGGRDPYDDLDYGAGPSRPAPMPYDDPYSDDYGLPEAVSTAVHTPAPPRQDADDTVSESSDYTPGRGRGRGRNNYNASGRGR